GELNSVIGEMRTKAYMLQNKINDLTHTLNSGNLVECGRSARVLTQKLIDDVPFLAKNTKAALRKILALLRDPSK
ncbi:hypothetical protein KAR91_14765, partial [Candidatus Pacearchaeota archaeon]|nr:hypothetical protein [Candidatus Pacearchaeota archaeon]